MVFALAGDSTMSNFDMKVPPHGGLSLLPPHQFPSVKSAAPPARARTCEGPSLTIPRFSENFKVFLRPASLTTCLICSMVRAVSTWETGSGTLLANGVDVGAPLYGFHYHAFRLGQIPSLRLLAFFRLLWLWGPGASSSNMATMPGYRAAYSRQISTGLVHKMAPSRSRALLPSYSGRSIQPGTANTSLPWFMALAAVFRLPLCRGRFHHQGAQRQAADDPVAVQEKVRQTVGAGRIFADRCTLLKIWRSRPFVGRRVTHVDGCAEHRHRRGRPFQRAPVPGAVDAQRQAGYNDKPMG